MMGQSQNQRGSSSTSPSRLSASAKPFTMKHLTKPHPNCNLSSFAPAFDPLLDNLEHITSSVSGLEPFSLINLEGDDLTVGEYEYHGYQSAVPFDCLQKVGPESYYPQTHSDFTLGFDSLTINETSQSLHAPNHLSIGVGERGKRVDDHGSFCWIEKDDVGRETMLKQGKVSVAEELKSCDETANSLQIKISNLTEKYNQPTCWGIEQLDADFLSLPANQLTASKLSTSSNLHSAALLDDIFQSQVSYREPEVRWTNFTSGGASYERSLSHIDSYSVKTTVPHSQEKSYGPAPVFETSGTTGTSSNNHVNSENFSFGLNTTLTNNRNSSGFKTSGITELSFTPDAEGKGVDNHEDPVGKGKERIIDIPSSNAPLSPLQVKKSAPQITASIFSDDFSSTHQGAEVCVSVEKSLDINSTDLDMDSPCWKGTQNSRRSPFEVSQPVNSHPCETEVEAHNSLNPLAPHFFPCYAKPSVLQNSWIESDFSSFQKSPTADILLSREYEHIDIDKGTSRSPELEVSSGTQTQCSNDIPEPNTENALFNHSNVCTVFNSSEIIQPYFEEDYFTSKDNIASGETVASTSKGIVDTANEVSTCVPATATECVPSTSLNGVVRTDISKRHQDVPNSLYRPSRIGGQMLVNAMSDLSELLVQNFSNDLDSLDGLEHDVILRIINNLYVCIRSRDGQGTLLPESTSPGTSYRLEQFSGRPKLSNMEVQVTRRKAMTVSHGQGARNSEQWRKSSSTIFSKEIGEFSGTSTGNEFCVEGGHVNQVIEKTSKGDPFTFREEMHPQTLLYRTLWLEAEAALCSMKYKAGLSRMKTDM